MGTREFGYQGLLFRHLDSLQVARHAVVKLQKKKEHRREFQTSRSNAKKTARSFTTSSHNTEFHLKHSRHPGVDENHIRSLILFMTI